MRDNELLAARALVDAATPGPWSDEDLVDAPGFGWRRVFAGDRDGPGQTVAQWIQSCDAAFIAASRTLAPQLLDEVERLRRVEMLLADSFARLRDANLKFVAERQLMRPIVEAAKGCDDPRLAAMAWAVHALLAAERGGAK